MKRIFNRSITARIARIYVMLLIASIFISLTISFAYIAGELNNSYQKTFGMFFDGRAKELNDLLQRVNLASSFLLDDSNNFMRMMTQNDSDQLKRIQKFMTLQNMFETNMSIGLNNITKKYKATLFVRPETSAYNNCPKVPMNTFTDIKNGIYRIDTLEAWPVYEKIMRSTGEFVWLGSDDKQMVYAAKRFVKYNIIGATAEIVDIGVMCFSFNLSTLNEKLLENPMTKSAQLKLSDSDEQLIYSNLQDVNYEALSLKYLFPIDESLHMTVLIPNSDVNRVFKSYIFVVMFICVMFIIIGIVVIILVSKMVTKPIVVLSNHIMENNNIEKIDYNSKFHDEISNIYENYNLMVGKIHKQFCDLEEAAFRKKEMEIELLQSQINPHFIFNALDNVNCRLMMMGEFNLANKISDLAKYIRYNIKKPQETTSIENEMQMMESYMGVFWLQYEDRVRLVVDIPEKVKSLLIPKMLIQPLVENGVMHGIGGDSTQKVLTITVRFLIRNNDLVVSVTDSGKCKNIAIINDHLNGKLNISKRRGYGIRNVNERIKMIFGESYGLVYKWNENGETVVEFSIPAIGESNTITESVDNCEM